MPPSRVQLWVSQRDVWSGRFLLFLLELIWTKLVLRRRPTITITWSFTWRGSSDSKSRKVKWNFTKKENTVRSLGRNCERGKSGTDQFEMFEVLQKSAFLYCYCLYWTHPPEMFYLNCGVTGYMMFAIWQKICHVFFILYVLVSDCDIFTCSSSLWPHEENKHSFSLLTSVFLSV